MGMNVGSQPNMPGNIPSDSTSQSSQRSSSNSDINQLLLLVPDLDKKAREMARASKSTKDQQTDAKSDSQLQALAEFAKSLIAEPDLPAGSKEALDKWISTLVQDQPDQATAGAPQQQAQAQGKAAPQTTTPTPTPGDDPNLLLMNSPEATPQLKTLGKLAQSMAASQGGKLTEEQANLLTKEAKEILGAQPSTLTDAGKQILEAFITQLEEFPKADDDNKTADTATRSATTTPQEKGGSAKAKADLETLVMDDLGLGDDVQQLGQQALRYVQANNGKLTEKESEQLKEAAEALIQGGADGDDLKALQNFLRTLLTFPRAAAGFESPLALTQPNIDPKLVTLSQYASAMLKGQMGTLTQAEANMLKSMAEELMSQLSPEDQAVLTSWLGKLGMVPVAKPPPIQQFDPASLFHPNAPKDNPFLKPGIMAMLAPILSEILTINNDIIRQSSKLKQSMMKLLVAMANEAFKFAIAAGQARANQLLNEAAMHMALGISSAIQAGMTAASFGAQKVMEKKSFEPKIKDMNTQKKIGEWVNEKGATGSKVPERKAAYDAAKAQNEGPDGLKHSEGSPEFAKLVASKYNSAKPAGANDVDEKSFTASGGFGEKLGNLQAKQQMLAEKGFTFLPTFLGQVGSSVNEFIQYGFMTAKVQDVLAEAANTAYKDMITQLMQLVTTTMQSASEEMQAAQKNWESFAQLYRDFANTITQSIYRSG